MNLSHFGILAALLQKSPHDNGIAAAMDQAVAGGVPWASILAVLWANKDKIVADGKVVAAILMDLVGLFKAGA